MIIRRKKKNGFTLLEVIISVATLSVISLFIVQMFMASSNLNNRARNSDAALAVAITEIERIKGGTGPWTGSDIKYYDNDWNIMDESSDNAFFILEMFVNPDISLPGLYAINTQVWELTSGEKDYLLSSLTTKKYFPIHAEVGDD